MAFGQDRFEGDMEWQELDFDVKSVKRVNCRSEPPTCPMETAQTSPPLDRTMKRSKAAAATVERHKVTDTSFNEVSASATADAAKAKTERPTGATIHTPDFSTADTVKASTTTAVIVVLFMVTRIVN